MKTNLIQLCCLAVFTAYIQSVLANETQTLPKANCSLWNSCEYHNLRDREVDSKPETKCACDQECAVYGDCCEDSTWIGSRQPDHRFTCVNIAKLGAFFMISQCPSNYSDPDLREKCERGSIASDPMGSLPVTDISKRITYRNIFCAMCHSDSTGKTFWNPKLRFHFVSWNIHEVTLPDFRENMVFNESLGKWTVDVTVDGASGTEAAYSIYAAFPKSVESAIRSCEPGLIEECPADWRDPQIASECVRYKGERWTDDDGYRNVHCALCNGVNVSSLGCISETIGGPTPDHQSFSVLLDINTALNGPRVGKIQPRFCNTSDQVYDTFLRSCRSLVCGFKQLHSNGRCSNSKDLGRVIAGDDKDDGGRDNDQDDDHDILSCLKIRLSSNEFDLKENGEAFVPLYNRSFNSANFQLEKDILYVCSGFLEVSLNKFTSEMGLVTLIGLSISIISLVLHIMAYTLVAEVRNLPGHNLVCLSISLIFAYTSFIFMPSLFIKRSHQLCTLTGYSVAYFFLASMAWMNVIAWDVWRSLRMATIELRVSHGKQRGRFIVYSLYAWLISGLFVGAAILTDHLPEDYVSDDIRPGFGTFGHCWFQKRRALLLFFASPIALIMTANLIFFILTTMMIGNTNSGTKSFNHQSGVTQTSSKLYLKLLLLMGLTWIVGFIASSIDSIYLWYLFIILNTLQGLFIFLTFSCKKISKSIRSQLFHLTASSDSGGRLSISTLSRKPS